MPPLSSLLASTMVAAFAPFCTIKHHASNNDNATVLSILEHQFLTNNIPFKQADQARKDCKLRYSSVSFPRTRKPYNFFFQKVPIFCSRENKARAENESSRNGRTFITVSTPTPRINKSIQFFFPRLDLKSSRILGFLRQFPNSEPSLGSGEFRHEIRKD